MRNFAFGAVCVWLWIAGSNVAFAVAYLITDLGPVGTSSVGYGINSVGQVTGYASTIGGLPEGAFLWTPTTPNGTTGSMQHLGLFSGRGFGINDDGVLTGYDSSEASGYYNQAFSYDGSVQYLGTLSGGPSDTSFGRGINSAGHIVGESIPYQGLARAFLFDGEMHDLGTLGGTGSSANAINDVGQIVGISQLTGNAGSSSFLWTPTTPNGANGTMVDLGLRVPGTQITAWAINASGQVVGLETGPALFTDTLVRWTPTTPNGTTGTWEDLGDGGILLDVADINASGDVVGSSATCNHNSCAQALLYTAETGSVDLNTLIDPFSDWHLVEAHGINDAGQITGYGLRGDSFQERAFLLTPITSTLIPGDYNSDGHVDGADYVIWQKKPSSSINHNPFSKYDTWFRNYGGDFGAGGSSAHGDVPEPASLGFVAVALLFGNARGRTHY